jgi:RNA polymerase sigma-70 factor (ECF subfamily)
VHVADLGEPLHRWQPSCLDRRTHHMRRCRVDHNQQNPGRHAPSLHFGNFFPRGDITGVRSTIRTTAPAFDSSADPRDEQLMLDAQAGTAGSFDAIFERYRAPVWRFFRRRVTDDGRAEELAQDVFTAVLNALPRYRTAAAFRSYLFAIAYNVLQADRRKSGTTMAQPLDGEMPAADTAEPESALWVRRALAQLEPSDREILMLREYEQLSYQEIADVQRVPLNTVRSRLFRARMALKAALVPDGRPQVQP